MTKEILIGFFYLIVTFSYSIFFIFQSWIGFSTEALFQVYSGVLAILVFCVFFYNINKIPSDTKTKALMIISIVVILFFLTRFFYDETNKRYQSYFLSMGVRFVPAVLAGILILMNDNMLGYIEKALFPFIIIYTIALSRIVFTAKVGANIGESLNIEGGMNYQNISYYAVFSLGLTLYLLVYGNNNKLKRLLLLALSAIQLLMAISAGSRGAFVLAVIFIFFFGLKRISLGNIIIYSIVAFVGVFVFESFLSNNALFEQGFYRIFNFFSDSNAVEHDNRWIRWNLAWDAFLESPILGNGIGSVFYKVGFYSHNIFTDLLCETGIIGISVFFGLLIKFAMKMRILLFENPQNEIFLVIFLCSFVNLWFSGYYLSETGIWISLAYVLGKQNNLIYYNE